MQPLGKVTGLDHGHLDLADPIAVRSLLRTLRPDVLLNAAAYTAVDQAESEEHIARSINADAVAEMALLARENGALFVHFSTDYVFDGSKAEAYTEYDAPAPLNAYGRTKWLGERALMASGADWVCLRTSWIYAPRGRNFLRIALRLAMEREELRIVCDQHGAPTSARLVAEASAQIVSLSLAERARAAFRPELLHLSAAGSTTWHGFAEAILQRFAITSLGQQLVAKRVVPITTEEYPTAARRPANSRLSCEAISRRFGLTMPSWEDTLDLCIGELVSGVPGL